MGSYFREQLETYLRQLDVKHGVVIDVGGSQLPIKNRVRKFTSREYYIFDLPTPHDTKQVPDMTGDLNEEINYKGPKADAVFCMEVMEYIWNPDQAIKNLRSMINGAGKLYITFPYIYPLHPPTGKDYIRYTKFGVFQLLNKNGFEVVGYYPRNILNKDIYQQFISLEGYRYDRSLKDEIFESGCIVKAMKSSL